MIENYRNILLTGHTKEQLHLLPNEILDQAFTSPPYWGLRDYATHPVLWGDGWIGELGGESTPNKFVAHLVEVMDIIWKKLKPTGSLWVNLGDTYIGGGQAQGHDSETTNFGIKTEDQSYRSIPVARGKHLRIKAKSLAAVPSRFKIAMIDNGWICRNEWIWRKSNPLPSPHPDRGTVDFEKIFFFTKNNKPLYWYNLLTGDIQDTKPLGTLGYEDIDWHKHRHKRCDGEGCKGCNNRGWKRKTLWRSRDYFFELQYEKFAPGSLERYYHEKSKGMSKRGLSKYNEFEQGKANADFKRQYGAHTFYESRGKHLRTTLSDFEPDEDDMFALMNHLLTDWLQDPTIFRSSILDVLVKGTKEKHFAVFPEKLVKLILDMGCPKEICRLCNLPVHKIYQTKSAKGIEDYKGKATKKYNDAKAQDPSATKKRILESMSQVVVNIKKTSCGCNIGFYNGLVLDPFGGRGTVAKVAYDTGRDYIYIELNPDYTEIAKRYLKVGKRNIRLLDII